MTGFYLWAISEGEAVEPSMYLHTKCSVHMLKGFLPSAVCRAVAPVCIEIAPERVVQTHPEMDGGEIQRGGA